MHWCPVALGVVFLLSLGYLQRERALKGQNDFVQLYAGQAGRNARSLLPQRESCADQVDSGLHDGHGGVHTPAILRRSTSAGGRAALPRGVRHLFASDAREYLVVRHSVFKGVSFAAVLRRDEHSTSDCALQWTRYAVPARNPGRLNIVNAAEDGISGGAGTLAMRHQVSLVPISPHSSIGQKALAYFRRSIQRRRTSCGIGRACERDGFDLAVRAGSAGSMDQPERDRNAESSRSGRRLAWRYTAGNVARRWRFADIPVDYTAQ